MDGLEKEYQGQISFVRLDANLPENARIQQSYGLRGHPSTAILNEQNLVVARYFGVESAERIRLELEKLKP